MGDQHPKKAAVGPSDERIGESTHAMWHDPTTYDPYRHGPPYLPGMGRGGPTVTASRQKRADHLDLNLASAQMMGQYGAESPAELSVLLSWLRAASFVHQTHHWQTAGATYYADHLLFDRLYKESQDMIDGLAERAVGSAGAPLVNPHTQAAQVMQIVSFFYPEGSGVGPSAYPLISLSMETHILDVLKIIRSRMQLAGRLSIGTDNLLQDIADKHEGFIYLLQQRTKTASSGYSYNRRFDSSVVKRANSTWYHLTERAKFKLDPNFAPSDNAVAVVDRSGQPGIYLGPDVERWVNGFGYWRPFVVEFQVDPSVTKDPGVHGRYGGEMFVPATSFDKLKILRVIPIDAHCREEFGDYGWIEGELGVTFDTGEPIPRQGTPEWVEAQKKLKGYRYPGPDVRNMPSADTNRLKQQLRKAKR